jgi:hypothetical protein
VAEEVHREECPSSSTLGAAVALLVLLLLGALMALGVALLYGQGWRAEALAAAHKSSIELGIAGDASPKTTTIRDAGDASPKTGTKEVATNTTPTTTMEVGTTTTDATTKRPTTTITREVGTSPQVWATRAAPARPAAATTTNNIQVVEVTVHQEDDAGEEVEGEVFYSSREAYTTRQLLSGLLGMDPEASSSYRWVALHQDASATFATTTTTLRKGDGEDAGEGSLGLAALADIEDMMRRLEALKKN